jgi:hypothetical protein
MMMNYRNALLLLLGSGLPSLVVEGTKVKRVKAGKIYKEHEAVHVVVNKVG